MRQYRSFETHYFNQTLQRKAVEKMAELNNTFFLPLGTKLFQYKLRNELWGLTLEEWRDMKDILGILKSI